MWVQITQNYGQNNFAIIVVDCIQPNACCLIFVCRTESCQPHIYLPPFICRPIKIPGTQAPQDLAMAA